MLMTPMGFAVTNNRDATVSLADSALTSLLAARIGPLSPFTLLFMVFTYGKIRPVAASLLLLEFIPWFEDHFQHTGIGR
jgi:hypothetical protein